MVMTLKSSYRCIMASPKARALRSNSSGAMGMISSNDPCMEPLPSATSRTSLKIRSFISCAARLVKVMARMCLK